MITRKESKKSLFILYFTAFVFLGATFIPLVSAMGEQENKDTRPERGISIAFEYPEITIDQGDEVSVDIIIKNKGKNDENIYFKVSSASPGWKIKTKTYSISVTAVHVAGGESKSIQVSAEPEKDMKPGKYEFKVDARTEDDKLKTSHKLKVTLQEKKKEEGKIELTTSYPVLQGSSDARFEFSLDLANKLDKEANFNLTANGPKDWQINFKPPYEDKYISSLKLKDNENRSLNVEVTPDRFAQAGEYYIPVTVSAGESKVSAELKVTITGTYKLEAGTATGLLSLATQKGEPGNISIYVKNTGSAAIHDIEFLSVKPENWKVDFNPENIEALEPSDLKQVEVKVVPAQEALVGDYAVGLSINGEKSSDDLELRVTVNASAAWSWIGIGIIVLVIFGLFGLFVSLGRR
ncbi:MAG TPA: NEW3 domain-containing protein [Desulfatiglandales bacterium]|nr:NEW3 domain-containing protein [Desulfatiglandales bacterium]